MNMIDMSAALNQITEMGIPTGSYTEAAIHLNGLSEIVSVEDIKSVIGVDVQLTGDHRYDKLFTSYIIYNIIEAKLRSKFEEDKTVVPDPDMIVVYARERADRFMKECAWTFMGDNQEAKKAAIENAAPEDVKAGKAKKGAKKFLGLKVYNEQIKGNDLKRKEAIEILMTEVGLTQAGASTYYANFKSGKWA